MKAILQITWQVGLLVLASAGGTWLMSALHLPVPGPMFSMLVIFLLLRVGVLRLDWVEAGANWLTKHLLLFFVPAAVGVVQYRAVMVADGPRIALVIAVSTVAVMICTGLMAESIHRRKEEDAR